MAKNNKKAPPKYTEKGWLVLYPVGNGLRERSACIYVQSAGTTVPALFETKTKAANWKNRILGRGPCRFTRVEIREL